MGRVQTASRLPLHVRERDVWVPGRAKSKGQIGLAHLCVFFKQSEEINVFSKEPEFQPSLPIANSSLSGDNQYQSDNRETNDKVNSLYTMLT